MGTIAAIDIVDRQQSGYLNQVGMEIRTNRSNMVYSCGLSAMYYISYHPTGSPQTELAWVYHQIDRVLTKVLQ